jgi:signal recognition particle GTPase
VPWLVAACEKLNSEASANASREKRIRDGSPLTIEEYLQSLEAFVDNADGRRIRQQFQTIDGKSELAMLSSPSRDEYEQLSRAVAIMTAAEKENAASLSDEQIERIADDAKVDKAVLAIFINGYAIAKERKSVERKRHDKT